MISGTYRTFWHIFRVYSTAFQSWVSPFKCSLKSSKKCKGRGILENGVFHKTKPHNHAPNAATIERTVARAEMRRRAEATMEPVQEIRRSSEAGMSQCAREEIPVHSDADGVQNWPDCIARKLMETE